MLSPETLISMASGEKKHINLITKGEMIMNKLNRPVRVTRIVSHINHSAVCVQLDNGTSLFYTTPNLIVLAHSINNGAHVGEYITISNANKQDSKLKNSIKSFSPESDIGITTYDDSDMKLYKTLYCISIADSTQSFYANGIIVMCEP